MDTQHEASEYEVGGLVAGYNRFGFELLRKLTDRYEGENVLLSPVSVASALALLYHGAGGSTRRAIGNVLWPGGASGEGISRGNATLLSTFAGPDPRVRIMMACALWVNEGVSLNPAFLHLAGTFYKAEAAGVDFQSPRVVDVINRWAREQTGGMIGELLEKNDLRAATESVLTNAVYFKGLWEVPFDKRETRGGVFRLASGGHKRVPMMSLPRPVERLYLEGDGFRAVSLEYGSGRFGMYFFLPDEDSNLKVFLGELNEVNWSRWLAGFDDARVELSLPRFESARGFDLTEVLSGMGLAVAFGGGADFSPMGLGRSFITRFKHKAAVEVNEEGAEAAAATAVMVGRGIGMPVPFVVDRPFFWMIRDNEHGTILFTGVVAEPD